MRGVLVAALLRAAVAIVVPVLPEEAYHWCYARHPAMSYYDHPPMIAWMIALGRLIFGDSSIGIRFIPWVVSIGTTWSIGWLSLRLHGPRAALWSVSLLAIQPVTIVGSSFGFPDAPLLFFWSLSMVFLVNALQSGRGVWWLAAGGALGGALLSKYTACFLGGSVLLYLFIGPRERRWLSTPWPYLGLVVALLCFSPVLYWNGTHDWASFRFQGEDRFQGMGAPRVSSAASFLAAQWGAVVPLVLPLAVSSVLLGLRRRDPDTLLLLCLSLPMLLFFFVIGWTRSTHVLWTLPAYLALTVLMGNALARGQDRCAAAYRSGWRAVAGVSLVAFLAASVHAVHPFGWLPALHDVYGWASITERTRELRSDLGSDRFVLGVGRRYLCAAQLAFHLREPDGVHAKNLLGGDGLQFAYWSSPETVRGRDAVIVAEADWSCGLESLLAASFREVSPAGEWTVTAGSKPQRYRFFVGREYRPPERMDGARKRRGRE